MFDEEHQARQRRIDALLEKFSRATIREQSESLQESKIVDKNRSRPAEKTSKKNQSNTIGQEPYSSPSRHTLTVKSSTDPSVRSSSKLNGVNGGEPTGRPSSSMRNRVHNTSDRAENSEPHRLTKISSSVSLREGETSQRAASRSKILVKTTDAESDRRERLIFLRRQAENRIKERKLEQAEAIR